MAENPKEESTTEKAGGTDVKNEAEEAAKEAVPAAEEART